MDSTTVGGRASATAEDPHRDEAIEFVRFCYRRKRVGWPELYDEMCAVAGRGLYQGFGSEELAAIGIGFGLAQMPGLAMLVGRVVDEDVERRNRSAAAIRASLSAGTGSGTQTQPGPIEAARLEEPGAADVAVPEPGAIRFALAGT
jgi:hypothetical protein